MTLSVKRSLFPSFVSSDPSMQSIKELCYDDIVDLHRRVPAIKAAIGGHVGLLNLCLVFKQGKFFASLEAEFLSQDQKDEVLRLKTRILRHQQEKNPFIFYEKIHEYAMEKLKRSKDFYMATLLKAATSDDDDLFKAIIEVKRDFEIAAEVEILLSELLSLKYEHLERFKQLLNASKYRSFDPKITAALVVKAAKSDKINIAQLLLKNCFSNLDFLSLLSFDDQQAIFGALINDQALFDEVIKQIDLKKLAPAYVGEFLVKALKAKNLKAVELFAAHPSLEYGNKLDIKKAFVLSSLLKGEELFFRLFELLSKIGVEVTELDMERIAINSCRASNYQIFDCMIQNGLFLNLGHYDREFLGQCMLAASKTLNIALLSRILQIENVKEVDSSLLDDSFYAIAITPYERKGILHIEAIELFLGFWQYTQEAFLIDRDHLEALETIAKKENHHHLVSLLEYHENFFKMES